MPKLPAKPDDPAQSKRFLEIAGEFDKGEKPADFERAFRKVVAAKRTPRPAPKKRAKR